MSLPPLFRKAGWVLVGLDTFSGVANIHAYAQTGVDRHLTMGLITLGLAVGLLYLLSWSREG